MCQRRLCQMKFLSNDACLHRQVLFHGQGKLTRRSVGTAPRSSSIKTLTNLPNVHVLRFSSDTEALVKSFSLQQNISFLMTRGLY